MKIRNLPNTQAPPSAIVSESDPGGVGPYRDWYQPSTATLRKRNSANSSWDIIVEPSSDVVDSALAALSWKESVRVATTASGTMSSSFHNGSVVDGVTLTTGDRLLIKDQASGAENGIYVVAVSGAPTRATDADTGTEILGAAVIVREGTTNADMLWVLTTNGPITIDSTSLAFGRIGITSHAALSGLSADDHTQYLKTDGSRALTGDQSAGSHKITNLIDPASAQDAATKAYVDAVLAGLSWKASVRAATTASATLSSAFANGSVVDGVTLTTGDRLLIKNQASGAENGIYVVAASGAPTRATDADSAADILQASVYVREGTTNADTQWVLTNNAPITLGSTALTFTQFSSGGGIGGSGTTGKIPKFTATASIGDSALTENTNDITSTKTLIVPAATTAIASINMPHGTAPTSPTNGDVWTTTAGIYVRVNGTTVGPLIAVALPTGGKTDHVLAKLSGTDSDASWRHIRGVEDVAPGGAADKEFSSSTLGGSALGSPTTCDADTTIPGALYISKAANSSFGLHGRYWKIATDLPAAVTIPFTVQTSIEFASGYNTFCRAGLYILDATPAVNIGILVEIPSATGRQWAISTISATTLTSGAAYVDNALFTGLQMAQAIDLRIVVTSSSNVAYYWRWRGQRGWNLVRSGHNPGFTVAAVGLSANPENASFGIEAAFSHLRFS